MDQALRMVEDGIFGFDRTESILMPIVYNSCYHLLILDKDKRKYNHYSSLQSRMYDADARDMVRIPYKIVSLIISLAMCLWKTMSLQRVLFEVCFEIET